MSAWKLIDWLIATVGIAGAIAIFVAVPNIFAIIVRALLRIGGWILSYRIGCALLAAIAVGFAVDYWRHSSDDANYAAQTRAFEQEEIARDKKIADDTKAAVWTEIANQTALNTQTDTEVKEFKDALPPIPALGNPFRIGADADKLRHIAGVPVGKPRARTKGVPKARWQAAGAKH